MKIIKNFLLIQSVLFFCSVSYGMMPKNQRDELCKRWRGQFSRVHQLMYEASLSEKPLDYITLRDRNQLVPNLSENPSDYARLKDHIATFNHHKKEVTTYLEKENKKPLTLTYEKFLENLKQCGKPQSQIQQPSKWAIVNFINIVLGRYPIYKCEGHRRQCEENERRFLKRWEKDQQLFHEQCEKNEQAKEF